MYSERNLMSYVFVTLERKLKTDIMMGNFVLECTKRVLEDNKD